MTLYGMELNSNKVIEVNLTKSDIAGMVGVKYGCAIKPEDVGGGVKKRRKRK